MRLKHGDMKSMNGKPKKKVINLDKKKKEREKKKEKELVKEIVEKADKLNW